MYIKVFNINRVDLLDAKKNPLEMFNHTVLTYLLAFTCAHVSCALLCTRVQKLNLEIKMQLSTLILSVSPHMFFLQVNMLVEQPVQGSKEHHKTTPGTQTSRTD